MRHKRLFHNVLCCGWPFKVKTLGVPGVPPRAACARLFEHSEERVMMDARILYFNHDNPRPSGGVRTIYNHVKHLVRNGLPAFVVHRDPALKPLWFSDSVPTLFCRAGLEAQRGDIVILPEDHSAAIEGVRLANV